MEEATLLDLLKLSRGILIDDNSKDIFYQDKIDTAKAEFLADDISETVLNSEYGKRCIVYLAGLIIDKKDRAADSTLTLMKNTLSSQTKGERHSND